MSVTTFARGAIRDDFLTFLVATITHLAVGDDDTAPTEGDTTLGNETFREATISSSVTLQGASFQIFMDTTENNGNDIKEIGSFDDPTTGNMYTRDLTNVIVKTVNIEVFAEVLIDEEVVNL